MKVVTYNIRCVWDTCDGINNFIHRAGMIYDKILEEKPDLIGFQEMRAPHVQFFERRTFAEREGSRGMDGRKGRRVSFRSFSDCGNL